MLLESWTDDAGRCRRDIVEYDDFVVVTLPVWRAMTAIFGCESGSEMIRPSKDPQGPPMAKGTQSPIKNIPENLVIDTTQSIISNMSVNELRYRLFHSPGWRDGSNL